MGWQLIANSPKSAHERSALANQVNAAENWNILIEKSLRNMCHSSKWVIFSRMERICSLELSEEI
jgi:hypothetical protein